MNEFLRRVVCIWGSVKLFNSYLTNVNKNITSLLMNSNVITYAQNIRLSL